MPYVGDRQYCCTVCTNNSEEKYIYTIYLNPDRVRRARTSLNYFIINPRQQREHEKHPRKAWTNHKRRSAGLYRSARTKHHWRLAPRSINSIDIEKIKIIL